MHEKKNKLWEVVQKIAVVETIFRDQWFKFASLWQLIQQKPVLRRRCMLYLPRQILYLSGTKL